MKRSHLLTIILLVVATLFGWSTLFTGFGDHDTKQYNRHLAEAEKLFDHGLFWKSGKEYIEALSYSGSEADWEKMLSAFSSSYHSGEDCFDDYLTAAVAAVDAYSQNENFLMQLVELYLDDENYGMAFKALQNATDAGLVTPTVEEKLNEVAYAFSFRWDSYQSFGPCVNDYFTVWADGKWAYMETDGSKEYHKIAEGLGPMGEHGIRIELHEGMVIFLDEDEIPQGLVEGTVQEIGVYSEELIPIKMEGSYQYYDQMGVPVFGSYAMAGSFEGGFAAVQIGETWRLVDKAGELLESEFDHIVLNQDGSWIKKGVMLAKQGGSYRMYNKKLDQVSDFTCENVDIVRQDGIIAFCNGGKWGFVDTDGEVVLEPTYAAAKSFSGGLAGVSNGTSWGFINRNGDLVIDYQFQDVDYFTEDGTCMVKTEDCWKLLELYIEGAQEN